MAAKRLQQDLKVLNKDPPPGVSADVCDEGDIFKWNALISGPGDTPFEGGTFRMKMHFPADYPMSPPVVWFYSRMFHPNVYSNGRICLDILEDPDKWNPIYDAAAILSSIQAMLGDPNPDSPANGEANKLFMTNTVEYEKKVGFIVTLSEDDDGDENLNVLNETDEVSARVEDLDISDFQGDPELLREFLRQN